MAVKLCRFEVRHPEFWPVVVVSVGPESATVTAAKVWGVPEEWGRIAGSCDVRRLGTADKPRCRRCGSEFGEAGDAGGLCPGCREMEERFRREVARMRPRDRRAGAREK